ncbi:MAG: hypothetical protein KGS61_00730, partial [Verrucomicrobia bacterium]|nr:hypothetical protein [Verrucomicrobiota bacterium]
MKWFKSKQRNRRLRRDPVFEVRLRTRQSKALRLRLLGACLGVAGTVLVVLALAWRGGEWLLDQALFDNPTFALQTIEVQTDGVLGADQIRGWAGVR